MASSARIDELRKKFEENPRRYFAPLANEYRKAGEIEQAIAICREYLPQQPGHMSGHIVYGQALYEARQFEEAKSVFETALSLDPENLIALRHLGDISLITGDLDGARTWYGRVLEADPRNEEIQAQLISLEQAAAALPVPEIPLTAAPVPDVKTAPDSEQSALSSAPTVVIPTQRSSGERTIERPAAEQPAAPAPAAVSSDSPTAEINLDVVPVPAIPDVDNLVEQSQNPAAPPVEKAAGFEPTSAGSTEPSPVAERLDRDGPTSPSREEPPLGSFSLEGLETTSIASAEGSSPPAEPVQTPAPEATAPRISMLDMSMPVDVVPPVTAESKIEAPAEPSAASSESSTQDLPMIDMSEPDTTPARNVSEEPAVAAAQSLEEAPSAPARHPVAEGASTRMESDPFVTETMAELYLQQGHRNEALRVYRALLEQRPGDAHLRGKIDQMEAKAGPSIRELLKLVVSRRPSDRVAQPPQPPPPAPPQPSEPTAAPEPVRLPAAEISAPATTASRPSPVGPDRLGDLFGHATAASADESAAMALAFAFFERKDTGGNGGGESAYAIPGAPAHPASKDLSLDAVFGAAEKPAEPASFSFDQFFSERATAEHAGTGPAAGGGKESRDDVAKFTQWLEGLKQR